jgi:hypothetical protein
MAYVFTILFLLFGTLSRASSLFQDDFDKKENSKIFQRLFNKENLVEIVPGAGVSQTPGLRVTYVGNEVGSKRIVSRFELSEAVTEASLSYDVKFEEDFQFMKGGKIHGLGPSNPVAAGDSMEPSRWSSRIMFFDQGKIASYLYHQRKTGQYGDTHIDENFKFQNGKFYAVTLYTKINSSAEASDGEAWVYIDGKRIVGQGNVQFWKTDPESSKISKFMFSTFFGGHDPSWAPKDVSGGYKNVHAIFDNFVVEKGLKIRASPGQ